MAKPLSWSFWARASSWTPGRTLNRCPCLEPRVGWGAAISAARFPALSDGVELEAVSVMVCVTVTISVAVATLDRVVVNVDIFINVVRMLEVASVEACAVTYCVEYCM